MDVEKISSKLNRHVKKPFRDLDFLVVTQNFLDIIKNVSFLHISYKPTNYEPQKGLTMRGLRK